MILELPKDPIHLHEVRMWKIDTYDGVPQLHRYVFHVFTKWSDYCQDRKGGADLVCDWMHYEGDHSYASGRICGWGSLATNKDWLAKRYATEAEAVKAAIVQLRQHLANQRERVRVCMATLAKLRRMSQKS